jgi:hypothetical protein
MWLDILGDAGSRRVVMSEHIMVDYARADAWKQRADSAAKAERLARLAVKAALRAVKTGNIPGSKVAEEVRTASEAATQAAEEAERVWANTTVILK